MLYYIPFLGIPVGVLLALWMFSVDANGAHMLDITRRLRHNNGIIQLRQLPTGIYRLHYLLSPRFIIFLLGVFCLLFVTAIARTFVG